VGNDSVRVNDYRWLPCRDFGDLDEVQPSFAISESEYEVTKTAFPKFGERFSAADNLRPKKRFTHASRVDIVEKTGNFVTT
jgi:hypothetical protein